MINSTPSARKETAPTKGDRRTLAKFRSLEEKNTTYQEVERGDPFFKTIQEKTDTPCHLSQMRGGMEMIDAGEMFLGSFV